MKKLIKNKIVHNDLEQLLNSKNIDWNIFAGKTFFITGATGTIGSFIIRALCHIKKHLAIDIKIVAAVRDEETAKNMYKSRLKSSYFELYVNDINNSIKYKKNVDYIIHAASPTNSRYFVENPADVFNSVVLGTKNVLEFAKEKNVESMVYLSSMEVYGDINDPDKILKEEDLGNIDIANPRSSYPMGKRAAETLCMEYAMQYGLPVKVARLAQVIGANVEYNDSRVYAQFARSVVEKKDIVLKTQGNTISSQCYITDVISAVFTLLLNGKDREIYNVANENSTIAIKDIAKMLCDKYPDLNLKFDISDTNMYPKETYWNLDASKIKKLGWDAEVSLEESYNRLIDSFYCQKVELLFTIDNTEKVKKHLNFWQKIFSITNISGFKQICILGFKLKIKIENKNLYKKYANLPIQKNKIVFCNFKGAGYGCNPKYIAEEIIRRKLPYEIVWLTKVINDPEIIKKFPPQIRLVKYGSPQALKELATAGIWVDNQRKNFYIKRGLEKKEGQVYIQTFHGSLGIKKVGIVSNSQEQGWVRFGMKDAEFIDYLISNSTFEDEVFESCFFGKGLIKKCGHARNDIFFKSQEDRDKIHSKVCEELGVKKDSKMLLYVPTFRDDKKFYCYLLDVNLLKNKLENKFGGNWVIIIRMHPNLKKYSSKLFDFSRDYLVDGSFYSDIQELLVASDIAITDYSSCIFDFMLSRKPGFIFATDIDDFDNERGFYYPLESTPFPVARNNQELAENIQNFDIEKYKKEVDKFLEDKGCMDDGHASERVVDLIEEILKQD